MIMSCSHQYIMIISCLPSHIILFNAGLFITCIVFILILIIYQYIYTAISLSIDIDNYIYIYIDMHITYLYIHISCMYPVSGSCNRLKHVGVFSFDLWFAGGGDPWPLTCVTCDTPDPVTCCPAANQESQISYCTQTAGLCLSGLYRLILVNTGQRCIVTVSSRTSCLNQQFVFNVCTYRPAEITQSTATVCTQYSFTSTVCGLSRD